MEYKDYQIEDLLNDTHFIRWAKYKENDLFWIEFIVQNPQKAFIVEKASNIINTLSESESIPTMELDQELTWYLIINRLFKNEITPSLVTRRRKRTTYFSIVSTAIILVICAWFYWIKPKEKNSYLELTRLSEKVHPLVEKINNSNKAMRITLEDSSSVVLSPGARLSFPIHFDASKREVFISGKSFFIVREDVDRPFFVNAGAIITRVLGTSFWINNTDNRQIEVVVKTGKVTVYERKNENIRYDKTSNGVFLTANHKATFISANNVFKSSIVEKPALLILSEESEKFTFEYDDVPLVKVLNQLEIAYNVDIELDRISLKTCSLTASLSEKDLFAQLDIICAAIQGSYEIIGTTILISGESCD